MWKEQVARGLIVASIVGAAVALGSSCSPVANSIPKTARGGKMSSADQSGKASEIIRDHTRVVSQDEALDAINSLAPGMETRRLENSELKTLRSESAVILDLADAPKDVEIHTILAVDLSAEQIEKKGLNAVEAKWVRVNPLSTKFALSLIEKSDKTNARRDFLNGRLVEVTYGFRSAE